LTALKKRVLGNSAQRKERKEGGKKEARDTWNTGGVQEDYRYQR